MNSEWDEDWNDVWIGFVELRLKKENPDYAEGYRGAFTTVVVRCDSAQEFVSALAERAALEHFEIAGIERLFPVSAGRFEINKLVADLIQETHNYPTQWATLRLFKPGTDA